LPFRERERKKEPCCGHLKTKKNTEGEEGRGEIRKNKKE